jgi:hypothetical protein
MPSIGGLSAARGGRHHPTDLIAHRFLLVSACSGAVRFDLPVGGIALCADTDPQAGEPIWIYDVDFRSESGSLTGVSDSPAARLAPCAR